MRITLPPQGIWFASENTARMMIEAEQMRAKILLLRPDLGGPDLTAMSQLSLRWLYRRLCLGEVITIEDARRVEEAGRRMVMETPLSSRQVAAAFERLATPWAARWYPQLGIIA